MAIRKKTSTTKLPQSLVEQLEETSSRHVQKRSHPRLSRSGSRKDARKQERVMRKQRKADFFSQNQSGSRTSGDSLKRSAESDNDEVPQRKRVKPGDSKTSLTSQQKGKSKSNSKPSISSPSHKAPKESTKDKKSKTSLEKLSRTGSISTLRSRVEEEEDKYIAYLESQLGSKATGKSKATEEDGLDDLLTYADTIFGSAQIPWLHAENDENTSPAEDNNSFSSEYEDEEWDGIPDGDTEDHSLPIDISTNTPALETKTLDSPAGRYVPPHLRNVSKANSNPSEEQQKLLRHLKGLLNRMSEQNISSIIGSIEELYRDHRRNDVTSMLTTLIIDSISNHSSLLDSFVVVYAAFVSSLHKIVGVDFAAHFVQNTVASYERHFDSFQNNVEKAAYPPSEEPDNQQEGKECSNLLVLISELYNFQVISSPLLFDVVRALLNGNLYEFKVELLLKLLRNSGQQLRQDDPSALKDIITIVQEKVSQQKGPLSSRTSFMIETLTNLKNNKLKRNTTQNQGGVAVERMKKFLGNLSKTRHVLAHEPLRVSLADLHSADTKGKWWLVGAAWEGNPLVDKHTEFTKSELKAKETHEEPDNFLKLAKAQGMNTEVRRGIFIVLMSSDDYVDACERLSQLSLNDVQQREIIRVLLHCCGNERAYNPYYTLVAQNLCRTSHGHKITLQYCIWDFLRDLGEVNVGGAAVIKNADEEGFDLKSISEARSTNVAKAYAWWIAKDSVSLLILKPVDFTSLKPRTVGFLKELLKQLFINSQLSTPLAISDISKITFTRNRNAMEEIFIKASRVQTFAMGLVYFLSEAFKADFETDAAASKFFRWCVEVAKETLRIGIDLVPTL
ncbi:hypothetical protein CPB83DRAFT_859086 [Crepidotus variabilis]|uniref:MI domain-containing protein n=1 Tax=Crepidotus variabilis TaxID=179855 RepID=A0A9P6JMF8_9AGAR|nr:hypothetical protein CPB83DRAFT_859086 [Crepidotus variabilis]